MKKKESKKNILLLVLVIIMAAGLGLVVWKVQREADREVIAEAGQSLHADHSSEYLTYQENNYPVIRRMSSVLLIGTDNYVDDAKQNKIEAFYNYNQSDFLVILVFDHDKKTVTPLQIDRDTMCSVPWLSVNGLVGGYVTEQIALSHTYGSGKKDSCENVIHAVRDLLYQAPVDHYLAFTMDAVPVVNDLVGGVTVTLEDDIPALGKEFVKGASITLKGQTALRFVRTRDHSRLDSNITRMTHQRLYLTAFTEAARTAAVKNQDLATRAFKALDPFMTTNLTVNQISEIIDHLVNYEILPVISPEGELAMGERFAEFYPDEASVWNCVYSAFCKK